MKERIKKWFLEPVEKNFWKDAFWTLFLFLWFAPNTLMFLGVFQTGLITPKLGADAMNETFYDISSTIAEKFVEVSRTAFESGQNIGQNSFAGTAAFYIIGSFIYGIYIALILLIINLIRYGISYLYKRGKK